MGGTHTKLSQEGTQWERIADSARFRELLARKRVFILPAFLFFCAYYFLLPVLIGFAPTLMSKRVLGLVTFAHLFTLSQFLVGGAIALLYLKASAKFDQLANDIVVHTGQSEANRIP